LANAIEGSEFQLDRFHILRLLGEGAEGHVHLATDTRLGRPVALKTLLAAGPARTGERGLVPSLDEARMISALSHPNIVTLYDAGEADGVAVLVFEFVEGRTLADLIRTSGRLEIGRAVEIAIELCRGVAYAHERGIVHRDIKPGNVMITPEGVPRLMDFGIAQRVLAQPGTPQPLVGTPPYMAPEYIVRHVYLPASDVFALGVLLYEMLAGVTPIRGADPRETLRRIVVEDFVPPSRHNGVVDEHLDNLVMKALAKEPGERYPGAAQMAAALAAYLDPQEAATAATQGTLEYLLRRIRHKGDFPALSSTISAVNRASAADREPVSVLCNSILRDVALTGRLLKIVNASALNQFGGSISTVSRAVAILGYDGVRNIAMSLVLFEHMHSRSNAAALKDQVVAAYFSGLLARNLRDELGLRDAEQAFICAMFHRLGRLLATFYLHDEAQVVERLRPARGWDEARAAREVLGISYEELGIGVARAWNFPEEILQSMRSLDGPPGRGPRAQADRLRLLAGLANELADVVPSVTDPKQRGARLAELVARYGEAAGITERMLVAAVQASVDTLARDAETLGAGVARNDFLRDARRWVKPLGPAATATGDAGATAAPAPSPVPAQERGAVEPPAAPARVDAEQRKAALTAGIQEITHALVGEHPLNDVLRIILETMYRTIGFHRVLLFLADARGQSLRCRFGFGPDVEAIVQRGLAAPINGPRDLFYAAVTLGNDLCIEDLEADKVRAHVPAWYRDAIGARGMLLLPIVQRKRTLGLIYADSDEPQVLRFRAEEMGMLRTLRNQALLALRQAA
jgi:serine/threonine protein kinase